MAVCELFAPLVFAKAIERERSIESVYAITDCQPAGVTLRAGSSGNLQMRTITESLLGDEVGWLPVWFGRVVLLCANRQRQHCGLCLVSRLVSVFVFVRCGLWRAHDM